jgi:anti-sigma regulatory factor (Ser/Thr protein kinase)
MADMTSEARVVALDRLWPDSAAGRCAAAGLTGSRLDDFVLAVHEISANAIVHAGTSGRLILRSAANGLRCLIEDHAYGPGDHEPPAAPDPAQIPRARDGSAAVGPARPEPRHPADPDEPDEPAGAETGRGLWLAAQLTDELSITSGPDSTIVSLYMRFE